MSDDRDDEVLDLTEEMKSEADSDDDVEPESDAKPEERTSGPPPGSPFTLLAKPRTEEEIRESRVSVPPTDGKKDAARSSFVPTKTETAVVTSQVVRLGEGGPAVEAKFREVEAEVPPKPEAEADEGEPEPEPEPQPEPEPEPESEPEAEAEADADEVEDDDEILDLGQEFVVADEVTDDDVGSEPIPLVTETMPPPEPTEGEEEGGDSTESASAEATAGSSRSSEAEDSAGSSRSSEAEDSAGSSRSSEAEDSAGSSRSSEAEDSAGSSSSGEVESHPFDFGVPEMVFDSVSETPPPAFEEVEDGEELDEADLELQEEEVEVEVDTEEIDLAEAVDLTPGRQPRMPIADVGPKPGERRRRRRRRKRKSEWWSQIFDDDYVALLPEYSKRDTRRELDYVEKNLGVKKSELVLDLACGGGRHSVGMARRNFRVVGVDISLSMLARAGELAQEAGQKINFIHGDMRDLGFEQTFDGVFCLGTSFGFFDEKTNAAVLHGVFRALKPGRRFLLEMVNRDYIITKQPNLIWFEGDGVQCMEETDFSYITSRLHVKRQIIVGGGERQRSHEFSLRLYSLHEIGQMLHLSGFSVIQVGGHPATPGAFFGADSAQIVIVAERRR